MADEFVLRLPKAISRSVESRVIDDFLANGHFYKTDRIIQGQASSYLYAFEKNTSSNWQEDFCVTIEQSQVYLCFYSATREQRECVINLLVDLLAKRGIAGSFEEI